MRPLSSLRARVTLSFSVSFLCFVLLLCLGNYLWARRNARRDAGARVKAAAQLIGHEWNGDTTESGIEHAIAYARDDALQHGWQNALDDIGLVIVDDTGKVIGANHPYLPWPVPEGGRWLTASTKGRAGTVVAGIDGYALDAHLRSEALVLLTFALLSTLVASGAAWTLVGRTRPIDALAAQAETASADAFSASLLPPSNDAEVRHLVATLNSFLDRLSENARVREQFYSAAAHELRTPLAVLSSSVEVALSRPRDNMEYRDTLIDFQAETRQLTCLVEDLLTLNRLNTADSRNQEDKEPVDLGDLCETAFNRLDSVIDARGLRITLHLDFSEEVPVPPTHATILIRNLIDNAVHYATPGGQVSASIDVQADCRICLRVYNDYAGAAELELDHLFEPFYRADQSRSRGTGGNGLGLAICSRIADAYGWQLGIQCEAQGITVSVVFPFAVREDQISVASISKGRHGKGRTPFWQGG